jgi:hypothetical protein
MRFAGGIQSGISKKKREDLKKQKEMEELNNRGISNKYKIANRSIESLDEIRVDFSNLKIMK